MAFRGEGEVSRCAGENRVLVRGLVGQQLSF